MTTGRGQTPSQTLGPFFGMVLGRPGDRVLVAEDTPGERLHVGGRLLDGNSDPVEDGLVELWQANAAGRYRHPVDDRDDSALAPGFTGFGRCPTGHGDGAWSFTTVRPGPVPDGRGGVQAPHLGLVVQARGMLGPLFTRLYFGDDEANDRDAVLAAVPAERRATLVAARGEDRDGAAMFHLDLRLQGPDETVFFDV